MLKIIRPEILSIQKRFFEVLDVMISTKQLAGLQTFCNAHGLNRVKYSNIRTEMRKPEQAKPTNYKVIDLDALMWLCKDFNVSADWLLLGKGTMYKNKNTGRFTVEKSPDKMSHWVCTDRKSGLICTFEHGKFSGKRVITAPIGVRMPDFLELEKNIREMGNWLIDTHRDKFF
ncbi:MAG: hypothetical protein LBU91_08165 [Bacteroidales bacterium]|jgi:hypothetical protein|nr:hypothetical protein [Bacteroidales bacterium]